MNKNFVEVDCYPRIQKIASRGRVTASEKEEAVLGKHHIAFLDADELYFELEQFKREKSWHNLNISKQAIPDLLANPTWYRLYLPSTRLNPEKDVLDFLLSKGRKNGSIFGNKPSARCN